MDNNDSKVLQVPIEDIIPNRFQPRLSFDENSLQELANSIKQHGIIQPLVLRRIADKYEIIAGERRYKAAMKAGLTSVPAVLANLDDNASAEVAIVENVQRKDLTAIEEAKSYKALLDKGYMTQEDLAKKMGLSQAAISNKLRLLSLDETVQDAVLNEKISERHARSLLKIKDVAEQKKMLNRVLKERLTVRQLEEEIKKMNIEETPVTPEVSPAALTPGVDAASTAQQVVEPVGNATAPAPESAPIKNPFSNIFSNPAQTPNKFFNILEEEAVNMSTMETPAAPVGPVAPVAPTPTDNLTENNVSSPEEEIEMLDFGEVVDSSAYGKDVANKIHNLGLDLTKVTIEEKDDVSEYIITVKVKKD